MPIWDGQRNRDCRRGPQRRAESGRCGGAAPGRDRCARARDPCVQPGAGGPGPRQSRVDRCSRRRRGRPWAVGRRAHCIEGQHVHARHSDHVLVQDPRRVEAAVRRNHRHQARCSGRRRDRQDQPRRVRDGIEHRELGVRPDAQPARHLAGARRQQWRQRGSGRRGICVRRPRQRHRRLDSPTGGAVRCRRCQTDVRLCQPLRPHRVRQQPRPDRPARHQRRRCGSTARRDRWPRSDGLDVDPVGAPVDSRFRSITVSRVSASVGSRTCPRAQTPTSTSGSRLPSTRCAPPVRPSST